MMGMEMLIKSLGIDPKQIMAQVQLILSEIQAYRAEQSRQGAEIDRQGRLLNAIARAHNLDPSAFAGEKFNDETKAIEHG